MTQGVFPVTIQAAQSAVWPWVSQLEKHVEWSTKPYRVEWVSGEPNAVGSRYRSVGWVPGDKDHVNEGVITERVEGERFALEATDDTGTYRNSYTVKGSAGGTEVTFTLVFPKMRGVNAVLVPPLFALIGKPDIRKRMRSLKDHVEGVPG